MPLERRAANTSSERCWRCDLGEGDSRDQRLAADFGDLEDIPVNHRIDFESESQYLYFRRSVNGLETMDRKNPHHEQNPKTPASGAAEGAEAIHPLEEIPLVPWESLDQGKGHLQIAFQGQIYHLRVTRNGKLILTK